jgi:hypothetical protein
MSFPFLCFFAFQQQHLKIIGIITITLDKSENKPQRTQPLPELCQLNLVYRAREEEEAKNKAHLAWDFFGSLVSFHSTL